MYCNSNQSNIRIPYIIKVRHNVWPQFLSFRLFVINFSDYRKNRKPAVKMGKYEQKSLRWP